MKIGEVSFRMFNTSHEVVKIIGLVWNVLITVILDIVNRVVLEESGINLSPGQQVWILKMEMREMSAAFVVAVGQVT